MKDLPTQSSQIIVEPHLIDAEFRKAWMPYFCRFGCFEVSAEQFLDFIGQGISLLPVPVLSLLLKLAMLLIGGSLLTFLFLLAFVLVPGWLMLPALLHVSLFGLLVG